MIDLAGTVDRARHGDTEAFGLLVSEFEHVVRTWCARALDDGYDVDDAAQEAFVTAYRKLTSLKDAACFPSWLKRITMTVCARRRRGKPDTISLDKIEDVVGVQMPASVLFRQDVLSAVRSLSRPNRECVRLHYLEGYSVNEVSSILRVPPGTVKRRLFTARNQLRQELRDYVPTERTGVMKHELEGIRWQCAWISHMGCIKGCLDYLKYDISTSWLYGCTGHAFIANIHEVICPSGPTAWHTEMLFKLGTNLGYRSSGIMGDKGTPDFAAKQESAWIYVKKCLDDGIPCYGWELKVPEFYVITGYDDVGYYFSGPVSDEPSGPIPWQKVADSEIGVLEMYSVQHCDAQPDEVAVKAAFSFAVEHAKRNPRWTYPKYFTGPRAFAMWADTLEEGNTASRVGHSYNIECWAECTAPLNLYSFPS